MASFVGLAERGDCQWDTFAADASGGGYWTRAPAPPLFADVAKQGTASVASGVRSPGAAPSPARVSHRDAPARS